MPAALRHVIEECFDIDRVNFLHVLSTYPYKDAPKKEAFTSQIKRSLVRAIDLAELIAKKEDRDLK